jgi:hypothetical protein
MHDGDEHARLRNDRSPVLRRGNDGDDVPPKLSARSLFWWGAALAVGATFVSSLVQMTWGLYSSELQAAFFRTFGGLLGGVLSLAQFGGIALVAGAFVVRSLER